jgi:transposase
MTPEAKISKKPESKKPAAKKKGPSKDLNKSAEIRKVADQMTAKGEKPRPVVIIEILKKQGIKVSSPQVSMVLKKMGLPTRPRKSSGKAKSTAPKGRPASKKIKVSDLLKAQKLVAEFGSPDRAVAAIQALNEFDPE